MSRRTSWIAALAAAMFGASLEAQVSSYKVGTIDEHWSRDAGPVEVAFDLEGSYRQFLGGTVGVTRENSADLRAAAAIGIYGIAVDAAVAEAEFEVRESGSTVTGEYSVVGRVLGFTLYDKSGSASETLSKSFTKSLSYSRVLASYNTAVGPIPVTVSFEVGSSLDIDITAALLPTSLALSLSGDVQATPGECELICGVGFSSAYIGLGAGVFTEVDFGRLDLHAAALVAPNLAALSLAWTLSAVCLELGIKAWGYIGPVRYEWTKTLFERSWGIVSGSATI